MFEHNTDRMFWTIAVLILGATLLMIGNKAFPAIGESTMNMIGKTANKAGKMNQDFDGNDKLKEDYEQSKKANEDLINNVTDLEDQLDKSKNKADDFYKKYTDTSKDLSDAKSNIDNLNKKVEEQQNELSHSKKFLDIPTKTFKYTQSFPSGATQDYYDKTGGSLEYKIDGDKIYLMGSVQGWHRGNYGDLEINAPKGYKFKTNQNTSDSQNLMYKTYDNYSWRTPNYSKYSSHGSPQITWKIINDGYTLSAYTYDSSITNDVRNVIAWHVGPYANMDNVLDTDYHSWAALDIEK